MSLETKRCSKCGQTKPLSEFGIDRQKKDGLYSSCRECANARKRASVLDNIDNHRLYMRVYCRKWRALHPEKVNEWSRKNPEKHAALIRAARERIRSDPAKYAEYKARDAARAATRRIAGQVSDAEQASVEHIFKQAASAPRLRCYLCGKPMKIGDRHVDHIVPLSRGGKTEASNLAVAHSRCNLRKSAKTPEEVGLLL